MQLPQITLLRLLLAGLEYLLTTPDRLAKAAMSSTPLR